MLDLKTIRNGITIGQVETQSHGSFTDLSAYSDADWAGDRRDHVSTSGFILFMNGGPVAWYSRKKKCIALSSTEAEYIALADCVKSLVRLRGLLQELRSNLSPTTVYEDNQSCISWVRNKCKRSKHVNVRYHYSRSINAQGSINMNYCPTTKNFADLFTKSLGPTRFATLKQMLDDPRQRYSAEEES